jgi:5-formyltetrahydrofolate cyclo-ligase
MNIEADDMSARKRSVRKQFIGVRKAISENKAKEAAQKACEHFLNNVPISPDHIVSGYHPIQNEINILPLMEALFHRGHRICLPVIEKKAMPLKFRIWTPECTLMEGEFGALIPKDGGWIEASLVILPMLAWDRTGNRLGYGGGFYDRTLSVLRARRKILAVGYAFSAQESDSVPVENTDQRLDFLVNEDESIDFRNAI